MDTSPIYAMMCEKATEIQEQRSLFAPEGDYGEWWCTPYYNTTYTWLPRQDQLQEMVPGFVEQSRWAIPLALRFADFCEEQANNPLSWGTSIPTFEQLWLAFVMQAKYRKHWTGEEWVNA